MKTKLFTLFLALVASAGMLFAQQSGTCGENLTWTLAENGTLTISGTGEMNFSRSPWSSYKNDIIRVVISSGVTTIAESAFTQCQNLVSVTIPNTITSIGGDAFWRCSSLNSITIPASVTSIGLGVLGGCSALTAISVATGNPNYDSRNNCNAIIETASNTLLNGCQNTVIPSGVTSIERSAFGSCSSLTAIAIPNGVTTIGENAFASCSNLTAVTIPPSVTSIGKWAFDNCESLEQVIISDIAAWCNITFPDANSNPISSYRPSLFLNDTKITDLVIPSGVTRIGDYVFYNDTSLTSVTIPESVTSIGKSAFNYCINLTSATIPESVTSIEAGAFALCYGLSPFTVPNTVTDIGEGAFSDITYVTYHGTAEGSPWEARSVNGYIEGPYIYSDESKTELLVYHDTDWIRGEFVIPDGVVSIGRHVFWGQSEMTSVVFPASLKSIGGSAFGACSGLTSITLPNSLKSIAMSAFYSCNGLTSVVIPASVETLEPYSFDRCENLTTVTINSNAVVSAQAPRDGYAFGVTRFFGSVAIKKCIIGEGVTHISNRFFSLSLRGLSVTLPTTVASIGDSVFYLSKNLNITCYRMTPPEVNDKTFEQMDKTTCVIYVPANALGAYKAHAIWGQLDVRPLAALPAEIEELNVLVHENTAAIAWPVVPDATTYELFVRDKQGDLIATLVFDAEGKLNSIAYNAPARRGAQQAQLEGFSFTLTGLVSGTIYDLTITAKDADGNVLDTFTQSFTTQGNAPEGIGDNVGEQSKSSTRKLLRDGHILIVRPDGTTYTAQGQMVR